MQVREDKKYTVHTHLLENNFRKQGACVLGSRMHGVEKKVSNSSYSYGYGELINFVSFLWNEIIFNVNMICSSMAHWILQHYGYVLHINCPQSCQSVLLG